MGKLGWFMSNINRNIPTTWRWACGDFTQAKWWTIQQTITTTCFWCHRWSWTWSKRFAGDCVDFPRKQQAVIFQPKTTLSVSCKCWKRKAYPHLSSWGTLASLEQCSVLQRLRPTVFFGTVTRSVGLFFLFVASDGTIEVDRHLLLLNPFLPKISAYCFVQCPSSNNIKNRS